MLIFANVFPLFLFIIRIFQKSWLIRTDTLRCSLILQCGQQITPKYISGIFSFQHQSMSSFFLLSFNIKSIDLGFSLSLEITQCLWIFDMHEILLPILFCRSFMLLLQCYMILIRLPIHTLANCVSFSFLALKEGTKKQLWHNTPTTRTGGFFFFFLSKEKCKIN